MFAPMQKPSKNTLKRDSIQKKAVSPDSRKSNRTGLPDSLKNGVEGLSGYYMDDVNVHYNSSKPAQFYALAYTQGNQIYVAPGQERHLAHEAWHVVQQKQGRVRPTSYAGSVPLNEDLSLEREADSMGEKAAAYGRTTCEPQG